jgi:Zn-dependent protease with chaperone function/type II secretory pathway pseudopilin PulG
MMNSAKGLRTQNEKILFAMGFVFSLIVWFVLLITIVGIFYGLFIGFFMFVAHAMMISYIKGHSVKISNSQFPDMYSRIVHISENLGLQTVPEVYLMQAGGMLNAFATKFTGRSFIVIYSDLLEACSDGGKEIDMIIGHEIGHLALGHLRWFWFLAPAKMLPWLGSAYSRACEYSSDLCGLEACGDLGAASRGLSILAAGGKYGKSLDVKAFVDQLDDLNGFWASIYELNASHPFLPKRVASLINSKKPGMVRIPGRNIFAYPLAPILGFPASGGSASLVMIAVIGVMAAIAIPQFKAYRIKAEHAQIDAALGKMEKAAVVYREKNGSWPCSTDELDTPGLTSVADIKGWTVQSNCEQGFGTITYSKDGKDYYRNITYADGTIREGQVGN